MKNMRKICMQEQTALRNYLTAPQPAPDALERFLTQHARLHTAAVSAEKGAQKDPVPSYADEVLKGLKEDELRTIPPAGDHSAVWAVWHMARIEDATMNILVAGSEQILTLSNWQDRINTPFQDSGNEIEREKVIDLSSAVNIKALFAYREAVGKRTRQIVQKIHPGDLDHKVDPVRIEKIRASGAVIETADEIINYWSRRTIAGLLLMPASRHILVHLNEIARFKKRL